jgi:hypothetical protein
MAERDDDERLDENVEAISSAMGALIGTGIAGPFGSVIGAALGAKLKRWVMGVGAELSKSVRKRQTDVLFWAIREGIPVDEMEARINASKRTELLTGVALDAAARTAWEDKVRTLGRSLAAGLLADDDATIDTEQMIIAAIADMEAPHLAMLDLLVRWMPLRSRVGSGVTALDIPAYSLEYGPWRVRDRAWSHDQITYIRPRLAPIVPTLLGTLQRHGLVVQNDNATEAIERVAKELAKDTARFEREGGSRAFHPSGPPHVSNAGRLVPALTWSPTELGEQVFLRFRDAVARLEDVWTAGPDGVTTPGMTAPRQP